MLDIYGRSIDYLRLSVTDRCNLKCRYCMPEEGIKKKSHDDILTEEEIVSAVSVLSNLGIRKVRLTGGEPLVRKNIVSICEKISGINGIEEVCMTTNATLLKEYAKGLKEAGLNRVNISLDTLRSDRYEMLTRGGLLSDALCGIDAALSAGYERVKINCVLMGGFNDDEVVELCKLSENRDVDVRFIELMPMVRDEMLNEASYIPGDYVLSKLRESGIGYSELERDLYGSVSRMYKLAGAKGNFGLITPLSHSFCAFCNRIRITPDGRVKPCLHSSDEYIIKGLTEGEMLRVFTEAIMNKPAGHGLLSYTNGSDSGRSMNRIGG